MCPAIFGWATGSPNIYKTGDPDGQYKSVENGAEALLKQKLKLKVGHVTSDHLHN
jgi:hypothetical protein